MEEKQTYLINEALDLLKQGIVLSSTIDNIKCYFIKNGNNVLIIQGNSRYKLKKEDFILIHKKSIFVIEDNSLDIEIDTEKDKEYYSWKQ